MPRNVQGLYTLPAGNPVSPGTVIESVWANTTMDDLAQAMTDSLPRNGSAPMTGPLTLANSSPSDPRHATSKAYVDQFMAYASGMPIGAVAPFAGATGPAGWLKCDGAAVSRTTYANLFTVIGTTFGSGDNSTTFNLPDLRSEFIRGRPDSRALGSKQAASFASHTHPTSDPGHAHAVSDPGHAHGISIQSGAVSSDHTHAWGAQTGGESAAHTHGVSDPGHSHGYTHVGSGTPQIDGADIGSLVYQVSVADTTTHNGTGISLGTESAAHSHYVSGQTGGISANHSHAVNGTSAAAATGLGVAGAYSGLSIGVNGGIETVPQNMALDYYIKAVADGTGSANLLTGVETSDANMISVDNTNPVVPLLVIHPNVAYGTIKLDASGKIPLAQMPVSAVNFLGYFDASSGQNPSEKYPTQDFRAGDTYVISVDGFITVYDPVTLVSSQITVTAGNTLQYVENSLTNPTGWYYVVQSSTVAASGVIFAPTAPLTSTNVQDAIEEVQGNIPVNASEVPFVPAGSIAATNTQAAIAELDSETQTALGLKSDTTTTVTKDSNTGAAKIPAGSTIQRPAVPQFGDQRANSDSSAMEWYNGLSWAPMGGGATGGLNNPFIYENDIHVTADYTLTTNRNGMSAGPIVIDNGFSVTVPPGSVWSII